METIKILKGWSHKDGETIVFAFSSDAARADFLEELRHDAEGRFDSEYYWNHNWETEDLILDPLAPTGK